MIVLARVIAQGARNRDESRGAHFKPEFPQRDDANWLRTTLAFHEGAANGSPDAVRFVRELDYSLLGDARPRDRRGRREPRAAAPAQVRDRGRRERGRGAGERRASRPRLRRSPAASHGEGMARWPSASRNGPPEGQAPGRPGR